MPRDARSTRSRPSRNIDKRDAEAGVGRLRAGDRLEQQVHRRAASRAASCVVMWARQQACVGTPRASISRSRPRRMTPHGLDRIGRRVDADDRVAAAEEQAVEGGEQDAAEIVGRMVRLHADAENARFAQRVPAAA